MVNGNCKKNRGLQGVFGGVGESYLSFDLNENWPLEMKMPYFFLLRSIVVSYDAWQEGGAEGVGDPGEGSLRGARPEHCSVPGDVLWCFFF